MLSKHGKPWDEKVLGNAYALGREIEDLVHNNQVSATQGQGLINRCVDVGVDELRSRKRQSSTKNAARNWKKMRLKRTFWPDIYEFKGPVWDPKTQAYVEQDIAVWLPLDLMAMLHKLGDVKVLSSTARMDPKTKRQVEKMREQFDDPELIGMGLHGDGIPNNFDRTESCFAMTLNLPGVGGKWSRMRIPVMVGPSKTVGADTMDAILQVLAWSFRHLLAGEHPTCRHDGTPWNNTTDKKRAALSGSLGFRASLVEVRGDWDWYSKVFHFPFHSELEGICWKCPCKRSEDPPFFTFLRRQIWSS